MICIRKTLAVVAVALALVACVTLVSDDGDAAGTDDGLKYTPLIDTASVSGYDGNSTVVVIPEEVKIDGKPYKVDGISAGAFENSDITEVYIPESVVSIGNKAFNNCIDLKYVTICGAVAIGQEAFGDCSGLKLMDFKAMPVSINESAIDFELLTDCSYRAPMPTGEGISSGFSGLTYIEPDKKIVRFETQGTVPEDMTDLGFAVKSTGDKIEIPEAAVRHGYDIEVLNGEEILNLEEFTVTDSDLVITLSYTYTLFSIDFVVDGEVYEHYDLFYNDPITLPEAPTKETDAQFIYSFKEWDGYTAGMTVTDDISFNAVFNETLREYTVQFQSDGKITRAPS